MSATPHGVILLYALRYALGRKTGAPSDVARAITRYEGLDRSDARMMLREVEKWLAEDWHEHPERAKWVALAGYLTARQWT